MKKLLSGFVLIAVSLGFSFSALAGDTLIARGGMYDSGAPNYLMSGCQWNRATFASYWGLLKTETLVCSGVSVAYYEYYSDSVGAPVTGYGNYYAVKRDGASGAVAGNFAIYKKVNTYNCTTGAIDNTVYSDLYNASMARGITAYNNPNICGGPQDYCALNVKAVSGGYKLWCGM